METEKLIKKGNFSKQIKKILSENNINQKKASEIIGITPQQFGEYVRGKNVPSYDLACGIIDKLNWHIVVYPKIENNE